MPHTIRLRTPWQLEVRSVTQGTVATGTRFEKVVVPGSWITSLGPSFAGVACYLRRFQKPTGIAAADRVELVCAGVQPRGRVYLNGTRIGELTGAGRWTIQMILQASNSLEIEIEVHTDEAAEANGLVGEVYLEIHVAGELASEKD